MRSHRNRFAWLRLYGLLGSLMLMAVSPAHATDQWFRLAVGYLYDFAEGTVFVRMPELPVPSP